MDTSTEKICLVCHRAFPKDVQECPDDRVRLAEKDSRVGTIFDGKYEILDFIGAGGLSRVYKVRHVELNRVLALKVLKSSELIDLQRFRREAISIGQLDHPNIARVFSFAVAPNGCPYMALEFLDGGDLAEWLAKDGPLKLDLAIEVFEQVALALEHAHSRRIIHRDIKPGNIMVCTLPSMTVQVKVVDFGMARFQLEGGVVSQKLTQEGEIFGTRQYISPEQYRGVVADERSDIYSLGVTIYESVLKDGKVPELLRPVISKATETDPTLRFQTADEMRAELTKLKEGLLSDSSATRSGYVDIRSSRGGKDFFGTFYFWTMLGGLLVVAIAAIIVVKQRIEVLESVSNHAHRSSLGRVSALSLAATEDQVQALRVSGQFGEAAKLYEDWLQRNCNSEKWSAQCIALKELASLYEILDNKIAAEKCVNFGLAIARKNAGRSGYEYVELLLTLASIKHELGDYKASIAVSQEVLGLTKEVEFNHELDARIIALNTIAGCLSESGHSEDAEPYAQEALDMAGKNYGALSSTYGEAAEVLAYIAERQHNYDEAKKYIELSCRSFETKIPSKRGTHLSLLLHKANIELKLNDLAAVCKDYDFIAANFAASNIINPAQKKGLRVGMGQLAAVLGKKSDLAKWK